MKNRRLLPLRIGPVVNGELSYLGCRAEGNPSAIPSAIVLQKREGRLLKLVGRNLCRRWWQRMVHVQDSACGLYGQFGRRAVKNRGALPPNPRTVIALGP